MAQAKKGADQKESAKDSYLVPDLKKKCAVCPYS